MPGRLSMKECFVEGIPSPTLAVIGAGLERRAEVTSCDGEASVGEEGTSIGGGDGSERLPDGRHNALPGAGADLAQGLFGRGERRLDRVQIRRVGREEDEVAARGLNQLARASALVHREIVQ